ncbi:hypothetical protein ACFYUL_33285 [Streptomyces sp. NPDC004311]|uniref:InlB B-repeat-containing protein n=1 Tax=Streptomyces sp. NPDC004311 TaxID=3364698 RepID=UPI00369C094C
MSARGSYGGPPRSVRKQPPTRTRHSGAAARLGGSADGFEAAAHDPVARRRAPTDFSHTRPVSQFGPYDPGAQVTVWATPNPGYRFDAWAVDGVELPDTLPPSYQLTMHTDHTITAFFTRLP